MLHDLQVTGNQGKQKLEQIAHIIIKRGPLKNLMFYI